MSAASGTRMMAKSSPLHALGEPDIGGLTSQGRPMLRYTSRRYAGIVFEFSQGRSGHKNPRITYWRCLGCKKLQMTVAIALRDRKVFLVDPDHPPREHQCVRAMTCNRNGRMHMKALTAEQSDMVQMKRRERLETGHTAKGTAAGASGNGKSPACSSGGKRRSAGRPLDPLDAIALAGPDGMVDDEALRRLANGAHEEDGDEEEMFDAAPRYSGAGGAPAKRRARAGRRQTGGVRAQLELDALAEELRHRRRLNEIAESRETMAMDAELQHMSECNQLAQQRMQLENSILELKKSKLDLRLQKLRSGELPIDALAESGSELDDDGDGEVDGEEEQQPQADGEHGDGPAESEAGAEAKAAVGEQRPESGADDLNAPVDPAAAIAYDTS